MGRNRTAGSGNFNTKYFGESYMAKLALAENAVVVLNRLCTRRATTSGGRGPHQVARVKRVDNYGYGFFRAGAKAVYASGPPGRLRRARLFQASSTTPSGDVFWTDPNRPRPTTSRSRRSARQARPRAWIPMLLGRYYRSVIGFLDTTVGDWRAGG